MHAVDRVEGVGLEPLGVDRPIGRGATNRNVDSLILARRQPEGHAEARHSAKLFTDRSATSTPSAARTSSRPLIWTVATMMDRPHGLVDHVLQCFGGGRQVR